MSNFIGNQTFTRVDFGNVAGGTMTTNNVASAVTDIRLIEGVTGDTVVFDRLVDNTTNTVAISARNTTAQTITAATLDDEEFVTYSSVNADADVTITDINAADLLTLTVSGEGDLIVTNAITSTLVRTVDASATTGAVTINASNAVVATTATAGSGVFTFTGGALADSITGGTAADILGGGNGADVINSGTGNDNVTGGNGADVINVGSGTDILTLGADAQTAVSTRTAAATANTIDLTGADVVTGMAASDIIRVTGLGYTAVGALGANTLLEAGGTSMTNGIVDNTFELVRGSWIAGTTTGSGTFIQNIAGTDTLFIIDADNAAGGAVSFEAVVLVGTANVTGTATLAAGVVAVTLATIV